MVEKGTNHVRYCCVLKNISLLANIGFDTAENEPQQIYCMNRARKPYFRIVSARLQKNEFILLLLLIYLSLKLADVKKSAKYAEDMPELSENQKNMFNATKNTSILSNGNKRKPDKSSKSSLDKSLEFLLDPEPEDPSLSSSPSEPDRSDRSHPSPAAASLAAGETPVLR